MMSLPSHKRGMTFVVEINMTYPTTGLPITGAVLDLQSQVRDKADVLMADLTITEGTTAGQYILSASSSITSTWVPKSTYYLDVKYAEGEEDLFSETLEFLVEKEITREEEEVAP